MAFFDYRAVNKSGRKLKGKIDAANIKQAISQLQAQDLFIVSIHSTKKQLDAASQKKNNSGKKPSLPQSLPHSHANSRF